MRGSVMSRKNVKITVADDISVFGDITNEDLLKAHEAFDKDNYNPLDNIENKEILIRKK